MNFKEILETIKKSWNWVWKSDSIFSWIVALIIIFLFIKFIFFPGLALIMGTPLPLAGVESSSMDHYSLKMCTETDYKGVCTKYTSDYEICGNSFNENKYFNSEAYWNTCGKWYEDYNITKEQFSNFPLKTGFAKGDIIIVWGRFTPKIGDVIIFQANEESSAPRPIIHRIIAINNGIIQTKGDHNERQLTLTDPGMTDETNIKSNQIIGKALFKIPYLGYVKLFAVDLMNRF